VRGADEGGQERGKPVGAYGGGAGGSLEDRGPLLLAEAPRQGRFTVRADLPRDLPTAVPVEVATPVQMAVPSKVTVPVEVANRVQVSPEHVAEPGVPGATAGRLGCGGRHVRSHR
jgi:hypothetical protein